MSYCHLEPEEQTFVNMSYKRLILIMGIPIPRKTVFIILKGAKVA